MDAIAGEKPPFFSIIMPTYNRAYLIPKAIESVLNQTFDSWELIIVDDGSRDNTKEIVSSYKDGRIIYIYQDNAERSTARNNGINHASGKFICFLDSDDYYLNNHLLGLYQLIQKYLEAKAMFVTDVIRNEMGNLITVEHEDAGKHLNNICYIISAKESVIPARVAIHREILEKNQFDPDLNVSEDADLWMRILAQFPLYQLNDATVVYHLHNFNSTNKIYNPYASQLKALKKIFGNREFKRLIPGSIRREKLSDCYYGIAKYYEHLGRTAAMTGILLKSLAYAPFSKATKSKIYMILIHLPFFKTILGKKG
jgi:glycosyltransferase involved in cell wall biosynthesis